MAPLIFIAFFLLGFGYVTPACKDVANNCHQFKHLCYIDSNMRAYLRRYCQRTCSRYCTGPTSSPGGCRDTVTNCADYKSYCYNTAWKKFMSTRCKRTCPQYCNTTATKPPTPQPPVTTGPPFTGTLPTIPPGSCGKSTVPHSRVVAGIDAKRGSWPWMVSLNLRGYHTCGGTLITPNWVLTAAHCTHGRSAASYRIVAGEHDRSKKEGSEQTVSVKRIINNPGYRGRYIRYDIALMELATPIKLDTYSKLVCMPPKGYVPAEGRKCYLSGWGTTTHPGKTATILQQAMMPVVNKRHCHNRDGFVCTGFGRTKKTNACRGDSGGPLVCQERDGRWVQHGVASFVVEYCKYYTAFTRISDHIDWIKRYVRI